MTGAWDLLPLGVILVLLDASYVGLPLTVGVMVATFRGRIYRLYHSGLV